ncbi:MAG: LptF/LptG family permease [Bacteroidetes bacterium]|nr:LptF/LptG family permease [Bacteroidota bacterium]MBS1972979.1 LptF/LptG family permease [Bacteroidota bacterium]
MKILDWYIIRKFLATFIFTLLLITVIAVVIDTSEKADDFVKSGLGTKQIIMAYYIGFIPFIMSMIFPFVSFISVIYFTSKMAGQSEFVAIMTGGVRYNRMLRPYVIAAAFLSIVFWMASQTGVPKANVIRTDFQANYVDKNSSYTPDPTKGNSYYLRVDSLTYVGMRYFDTTSKSAGNFFLEKIKNDQEYYNLRADRIRWDTAKKMWKADNAIERKINGLHEAVRKVNDTLLNLNIKPSELKRDEYLKDKLTTAQLKQFIHMQQVRGVEGLNIYKVELYHRDATPFSVIILTLIGAIIASRKIRGGSGFHLALGIIMAFSFVVMDKFAVTFATKGHLSPVLAAWMPNIIFAGVVLWLYRRTPK